MKAWRKGGGIGATSALPLGPVLVALESEQVRLEGDPAWAGTRFVLFQLSPSAAGPWANLAEEPITTVPEVFFDYLGFAGNWGRGALSLGDLVPITAWSEPVQILA